MATITKPPTLATCISRPANGWTTGKRYHGSQLLHEFALPPGKTPLFVGGAGIVAEERGAQVVARVYPIASGAESFLIDRDGVTRATIRVHVSDWKKVSISAGSGRAASGAWRGNAFEFVTVPGESYELR